MEIPPGIIELYRILTPLVLPLVLTHAVFRFGHGYLSWTSSSWVHILALLLVNPLVIFFRRTSTSMANSRQAHKLGAVMIPTVRESTLSIFRTLVGLDKEYPGDSFGRWAEIYGETFALSLVDNLVLTTEPAHIKAIAATQFEDFEKGPVAIDQFDNLLGSGIFNSEGNTWKFHRTMARPFFSKERISDYEIFARHTDETINKLGQRLREGHPVEFTDLIARFTLDSASEFLFGKSVCSIEAGLPYPGSTVGNDTFRNHPSNSFVSSFTRAQEIVDLRLRVGSLWRLNEFWKNAVNPHRKVLNDFVDPIIKEARMNKDAEIQKEDETFLSHLLEHTDDHKVIQEELISMLVAGRDTTASTLSFAVHIFTQRPDILKRLRGEIIDKVGMRYPNYQDIRDMKYLRAFINEILRLYPIVPFNGRTAKVSTTLPSTVPGGKPFFVPAKTICIFSPLLLHRRKDLWGPDALEFDPDRFIDDRLQKYLVPNPYIFVPFHAGPRICIGQQFAYNEVSFFLIRLLQRFDAINLAVDVQPESTKPPREWAKCAGPKGRDKIRLQQSLTMKPMGGIWLRMTETSSNYR